MSESSFLISIARDYNPRIEAVLFNDLTFLKGRPLGIAWQRRPEEYLIEIDKDRLICPRQVLYVFYHELGHIMQYHLGYRHALGAEPYREEEADAWAFQEMGMIDAYGQVKEESKICYQCMKAKSKVCLKKID